MPPKKRGQKQAKPKATSAKRSKVEASSSASAAQRSDEATVDEQLSTEQPDISPTKPSSASQHLPGSSSAGATSSAASPGLLILSAEDVQRCLARMSVQDICDGQEAVFRAISKVTYLRRKVNHYKGYGQHASAEREEPLAAAAEKVCQIPKRLAVDLDEHTALFMPARVGGHTACKIVGVPKPASTSAGATAATEAGIPGSTILVDGGTAKVKAIIDATVLTALRTAAGSALATQMWHPVKSFERGRPLRLVIFGGGRQAFYHAWMLYQVYQTAEGSEIGRIDFVTRRPLAQTALPQLAKETKAGQPRQGDPHDVVRIGDLVAQGVTSDNEEAVADLLGQADVICCCTPSTEPLFRLRDINRGTHVNLVGSYKPHMQEVEPELILEASREQALIIDSYAACGQYALYEADYQHHSLLTSPSFSARCTAHEAGELIKAGIHLTGNAPTYSKRAYELGNWIDSTETEVDSDGSGSERAESWSPVRHRDHYDNLREVSVFKSVGVGAQDVRIAEDIYREATREGQPLIGTRVPY